jgi:multiple sugar transport system permease protein
MSRKRTLRPAVAAAWIAIAIGAAIACVPFIVMISNSFEKFTYSLPFPPRLFPRELDFSNYAYVLRSEALLVKMRNSLVVTLSTMAAGMFISCLSAYAFARIRFPAREQLFTVFLFTLMLPGVLNLIPQFMILQRLGLSGTLGGLVLLYVGVGVAGNTFFLRDVFMKVPKELDESILMDGGGDWIIFSRLMLPLSKPGIATLAVFLFQGTWDEFLTAKVVLGSKESLLTLPVMVQRLFEKDATKWGYVFAASMLMLIPTIVLYCVAQRKWVVGGLSEGAIKA